MTLTRHTPIGDPEILPPMPGWVTSAHAETLEDVAFLSGAALNHLHVVLGREEMPQSLLRERLALRAAEACVAFSGRPERAGELRDAVHLMRPGDLAGPAGEVYLAWTRAVGRPVSPETLRRALPGVPDEQIGYWSGAPVSQIAGRRGAVAIATGVLQAVLAERPGDLAAALILADAALAKAFGWSHVVPLLASGFRRRDLRLEDDELRLACHHALVASAGLIHLEAAELARRAARLRAVAPKLRAKGSDRAVAQFLSRDAIAPAALTSLNSDRAARRFCDRLVDLGAVRELTGRDTFRLFGV